MYWQPRRASLRLLRARDETYPHVRFHPCQPCLQVSSNIVAFCAAHSVLTATKIATFKAAARGKHIPSVVPPERQFFFDGPNGHHLCLVLPVLGPSLSELSDYFTCWLTPQFCRKVTRQATKAMADLHCNGFVMAICKTILDFNASSNSIND